mgnify:FL=1
MPIANKMNKLLDKIERRLGTSQLKLPDYLSKDKWASVVISNETLDTFSRYFPNTLKINLDLSTRRVDGWYVIDEYVPDGVEILGVRDIDWTTYNADAFASQQAEGYGVYGMLVNNYGLDDIALAQMRADMLSLYNNNIFVDFKAPNLVKVNSVSRNDMVKFSGSIPIELLIKHADNLMTIPATMMEIFEDLAQADVATFLYQELKYYDGLETVYANIDLRLNDLADAASKRSDIVSQLEDSYVSAANKNQPIMFTV